MKSAGHLLPPLLIEWSPKRVRAFDPSTHKVSLGASISECVQAPGREAILAVSQRSAFIRSMAVPKASYAEIAKVVGLQIGTLLPLNPSDCVFGFRLGHDTARNGPLAVIGAVKIESLRKIHAEAAESGTSVLAVLPVAFGAWLAARERGLSDCIAVEADGDVVNMDVIQGGEIRYSRSIPMPPSPDALPDEIARTFKVANASPSQVFSTGCPGVRTDVVCPKEALQYLGDMSVIKRQLFSIELPEKIETQRTSVVRWKARRALAAVAVASAVAIYAAAVRISANSSFAAADAGVRTSVRSAQAKIAAASNKAAKVAKSNRILDVAFSPGQTISDAVTALSNSASNDSWFTSLSIVRGAPVSISGLAMSDEDITKFTAAVSKDPRFEEMKVVSSNKTLVGKKSLIQFLVFGKLRGVIAFDHPPKARKKT